MVGDPSIRVAVRERLFGPWNRKASRPPAFEKLAFRLLTQFLPCFWPPMTCHLFHAAGHSALVRR